MTNDRTAYVQALAAQLAKGVNDAFQKLQQRPPPTAPPAQQALHLDEFTLACAALQQGFEILGQRATEAATEILDDAQES